MLLATLEYLREYALMPTLQPVMMLRKVAFIEGGRWIEDTLIKDGMFSLPGQNVRLKSEAEYEAILGNAL